MVDPALIHNPALFDQLVLDLAWRSDLIRRQTIREILLATTETSHTLTDEYVNNYGGKTNQETGEEEDVFASSELVSQWLFCDLPGCRVTEQHLRGRKTLYGCLNSLPAHQHSVHSHLIHEEIVLDDRNKPGHFSLPRPVGQAIKAIVELQGDNLQFTTSIDLDYKELLGRFLWHGYSINSFGEVPDLAVY